MEGNIELASSRKSIYTEQEEVRTQTDFEVLDSRRRQEIVVSGTRIPKLLWRFEQAGLCDEISAAITRLEWTSLTPVQAQALPALLSGRDVLGVSKKASGKSSTYLLSALAHIFNQEKTASKEKTFCLVILPTEKKAAKVKLQADQLTQEMHIHVCHIRHESRVEDQKSTFNEGCHICICTVGTINSLIDNESIDLNRFTYLIVDELSHILGEATNKAFAILSVKRDATGN